MPQQVNNQITGVDLIKTKNDIANFNKKMGKPADPKSAMEEVSQDKFLKLLVIQLSKQDPLNPMKNTEFMAQMAQFSALEQMTRVNKQISTLATVNTQLQAHQFLGKNITYRYGELGKEYKGVVNSIKFNENGNTLLVVNEDEITIRDIVRINFNGNAVKAGKAYEANTAVKQEVAAE
jgi:flagellar basal-body rod modification protein FlgD